jgi:hypothetical protein
VLPTVPIAERGEEDRFGGFFTYGLSDNGGLPELEASCSTIRASSRSIVAAWADTGSLNSTTNAANSWYEDGCGVEVTRSAYRTAAITLYRVAAGHTWS